MTKMVKAVGLLLVAVVVLTVGIGHVYFAGAFVAIVLIAATARLARPAALTLLICAPILLPTIVVAGTSLENIAFALGIVYGLVDLASRPRVHWAAPLYCLLALGVLLSGVARGAPAETLTSVVRLTGLALLPCLIVGSQDAFARRILGLSLLGACVSVILQPWTGFPAPVVVFEGVDVVRFGGLIGHPNFNSYALAIYSLYLLSQKQFSGRRVCFLLLALLAMFLAGSLTATLLFLVIGSALVVRDPSKFILGALLAFSLVISLGGAFLVRLSSLSDAGGSGRSLEWRFAQWRTVWRLPREDPLFGLGWDKSAELVASRLPPHNMYLQIVVELGVVGLGLFAVGLIYFTRGVMRYSRAAFASWLYTCLASVLDPLFVYPAVATTLLVVAAVARDVPCSVRGSGVPRDGVPMSQLDDTRKEMLVTR